MDAIKTTGKFRLISIGRVQGPTLHMIVDKEKSITDFKSEKYWQVFADVTDNKSIVEVKYVKDRNKEKDLEFLNKGFSTEKKEIREKMKQRDKKTMWFITLIVPTITSITIAIFSYFTFK